jgi:predicted RNA-binding Zn-ribbon protein involved in translation (DUF1610 family)
MTEDKIRIKFCSGKDENGNEISFIEFQCPSCKSAIITLPTTTSEKEYMTFTCDSCGNLQYFEKPAKPEGHNS